VTDDGHDELREVVRDFLVKESPESEVRKAIATPDGFDRGLWRRLAEIELPGIGIPEQYGGQGFGFAEIAVVLEETGRSLLCAPYLSTAVIAAQTLLAAEDDTDDAASSAEQARADLLPRIARGEAIVTLAIAEDSGRWDEPGVTLSAVPDGDTYSLTGVKSFVLDGHAADVLLVAGRTSIGVTLFRVDAGAPGLTVTPLDVLDLTRKLARAEFSGVPARRIGPDGGAWPVLSRVLDLAAIALGAEQAGGAQRCLEMSVEYAKVRQQFGRPIGSFQAIKHKCADMLLQVESARAAVRHSAAAVTRAPGEVPCLAPVVKSYCSEAFSAVAAETIQVHGGIGFTWEHAAHLYFRRAKSSEVLFGSPAYHRDVLTTRLAS
jgi:alkylation response protein AidB-like acyl-CoA dehydrogenase